MPISQYNSPCLDTLTPHSIHLLISIQPKNNMVTIPTLNQPMVQKPNKMNQQLLPYLLTSKESPRYKLHRKIPLLFLLCLRHHACYTQHHCLRANHWNLQHHGKTILFLNYVTTHSPRYLIFSLLSLQWIAYAFPCSFQHLDINTHHLLYRIFFLVTIFFLNLLYRTSFC